MTDIIGELVTESFNRDNNLDKLSPGDTTLIRDENNGAVAMSPAELEPGTPARIMLADGSQHDAVLDRLYGFVYVESGEKKFAATGDVLIVALLGVKNYAGNPDNVSHNRLSGGWNIVITENGDRIVQSSVKEGKKKIIAYFYDGSGLEWDYDEYMTLTPMQLSARLTPVINQ